MKIEVTDTGSRYEVAVDGALAGFADYSRHGNTVVFPHTEVKPQFEGKGIGSALIKHALDQERAAGHLVHPACPFVSAFIDRNPEYADLVDPAWRRD